MCIFISSLSKNEKAAQKIENLNCIGPKMLPEI